MQNILILMSSYYCPYLYLRFVLLKENGLIDKNKQLYLQISDRNNKLPLHNLNI